MFLPADAGVALAELTRGAESHVFFDQEPHFPGYATDLFSGTVPLSQLKLRDVCYKFRTQLSGWFLPTDQEGVEFVVDGFGSAFIGRGETHEDARSDWDEQIHAAFQRLIRMRPFEMTDNDEKRWQLLEDQIDVPMYRRTTPTRMRQVGRANYCRTSRPRGINWANGGKDYVDLNDMPAAFAALKPNQWFEAVVLRDPLSGLLRKVLHIDPIKAPRAMSESEQSEFFASLPSGVGATVQGDQDSDGGN